VRALAIYKFSSVAVRQVTIERSGFWSLLMTYSDQIAVDGVIIRANVGGHGPSSDGIAIDSSRNVLVENCDSDCNDDNICLKSGRDADGLRGHPSRGNRVASGVAGDELARPGGLSPHFFSLVQV